MLWSVSCKYPGAVSTVPFIQKWRSQQIRWKNGKKEPSSGNWRGIWSKSAGWAQAAYLFIINLILLLMRPDYPHKYYPDNRFRLIFLMNVIAFDYGAAQKKLAGSRGVEVSLQYPIHFFSCCISAMEIFLNKFSTICLAKKKVSSADV